MGELAGRSAPPSDLYHEITQLLYREARLLDTANLSEWLNLMTDDAVYQVPVRLTREREQERDFSLEMYHFDESRQTLQTRVDRLKTEFAWAEDPPSRTRHFVSNIHIELTPNADEIEVYSYILVYRNRANATNNDLISGERQDLFRHVNGHWKLAKRWVIIDQATLGTKNLAIFL